MKCGVCFMPCGVTMYGYIRKHYNRRGEVCYGGYGGPRGTGK